MAETTQLATKVLLMLPSHMFVQVLVSSWAKSPCLGGQCYHFLVLPELIDFLLD